jgi:MYXO-CTERM domain-containing protein
MCGNGVDDNCRDGTDETCGCTDNDGDGYCEADDCDDWRATTSPGAPEICGDNEDNDCDGAWDEDDTDCPFADDGGCGCAIPASRGGGGLLAALLLGFVLRRRTRRRR